jgi:hypothetical protein
VALSEPIVAAAVRIPMPVSNLFFDIVSLIAACVVVLRIAIGCLNYMHAEFVAEEIILASWKPASR